MFLFAGGNGRREEFAAEQEAMQIFEIHTIWGMGIWGGRFCVTRVATICSETSMLQSTSTPPYRGTNSKVFSGASFTVFLLLLLLLLCKVSTTMLGPLLARLLKLPYQLHRAALVCCRPFLAYAVAGPKGILDALFPGTLI